MDWRSLVRDLWQMLWPGKKNPHERLRGHMEMIDFQLAQWIDNNPTIGAFESARKFAGGEVVYIEENVAVGG